MAGEIVGVLQLEDAEDITLSTLAITFSRALADDDDDDAELLAVGFITVSTGGRVVPAPSWFST